jgi:hypothetical protein
MKLLLILALLASSVLGQSTDINDYKKAYYERESRSYYSVDITSFDTIRTGQNKGHVIFWSMNIQEGIVVLFWNEADCKARKLRTIKRLSSDGIKTISIDEVTPWFSKSDPVSNSLIFQACATK